MLCYSPVSQTGGGTTLFVNMLIAKTLWKWLGQRKRELGENRVGYFSIHTNSSHKDRGEKKNHIKVSVPNAIVFKIFLKIICEMCCMKISCIHFGVFIYVWLCESKYCFSHVKLLNTNFLIYSNYLISLKCLLFLM